MLQRSFAIARPLSLALGVNMAATKMIEFAQLFTEVLGFVLLSYGLLRQSFADVAAGRPYGAGAYGTETFGVIRTTGTHSYWQSYQTATFQ